MSKIPNNFFHVLCNTAVQIHYLSPISFFQRHNFDEGYQYSWLHGSLFRPWCRQTVKSMLTLLKHPECYTCQIGIYDDMPRTWLLKKDFNDIIYLLEAMTYNDECPELRAQLTRVTQQKSRSVNEIKPGTDLNGVVFPLPVPIQEDPLVLRAWGPFFKWNNSFTDYISREPELVSGDRPNPHNLFADLVASEREHHLDTKLEESSAWEQIQPNLLDVPTPEQERIWRIREKRTELNDEERMKERRREIADNLTRRHDWPLSKVEPFLIFADTLKAGWEAFQVICRMDWIPPRGPFNRRKPAKTADMDVRK